MSPPRIPPVLLRASFVLGVIGTFASLAIHVSALRGTSFSEDVGFGFHIGAMAVFAPVIIALIRRAEAEGIRQDSIRGGFALNAWMFHILSPMERVVFGLLLAYTLTRFFLGFFEVVQNPPEGFPFVLFSAAWLYFFAVSALYSQRLLRLGPAETVDRQGL